MESVSGVTSSRRISLPGAVLPAPPPPAMALARVAAWMAAPQATHSSGLMELEGRLPVSARTCSCTAGMRVEPPTSSTWSSSAALTPASRRAWLTGPEVRSTRSAVMASKAARVTVTSMCTGWPSLIARKGRLTVVCAVAESSCLAWVAASRTRCMPWASRLTRPLARSNSLRRWSARRWSKSSPPRWLSPQVARTSMTSSPIPMTETSKVPPPRS